MLKDVIEILVYYFAFLLVLRWVLWAASEVKREDSLDGMNYFELRDEVNRVYRNYMRREKRRSMRNDRY